MFIIDVMIESDNVAEKWKDQVSRWFIYQQDLTNLKPSSTLVLQTVHDVNISQCAGKW